VDHGLGTEKGMGPEKDEGGKLKPEEWQKTSNIEHPTSNFEHRTASNGEG
jgi:hypothetical protein